MSLYYVNKDVDFSGYCGYDEQWAKINSKWQYRFILFDLIKRYSNCGRII
jgi:hypothetical protein